MQLCLAAVLVANFSTVEKIKQQTLFSLSDSQSQSQQQKVSTHNYCALWDTAASNRIRSFSLEKYLALGMYLVCLKGKVI